MNDASVGMTLAECRAKFSEICSDIEHRLGVRFERTTRKSDKEAVRMIDDELKNPNWRKGGSVIGFSRTFLWSGARMRVGESGVPDVTVTLRMTGGKDADREMHTETDERGAYLLQGVMPGTRPEEAASAPFP